MHETHHQNPFHHIECWTGTYFRQAELWEVGTHILVNLKHETGVPICKSLEFQIQYLEAFEDIKDKAEQLESPLANTQNHPQDNLALAPPSWGLDDGVTVPDSTVNECGQEDATKANATFFHHLDALFHEGAGNTKLDDDGLHDIIDGDDECEVQAADEDIHGFAPYLPNPDIPDHQHAEQCMTNAKPTNTQLIGAKPTNVRPTTALLMANALNNTYVCVVHTNRVHHLAMVTCSCIGEH
jgi:hypothetical protein